MYFETDWVKRVDYDLMRKQRLARARETMDRFGLDALLVFKQENTRYLAGLRPLWMPIVQVRNAVAISRFSDEVICLINGGDWEHRQATMTWLKPENIRICPPLEDPVIVERSLPILRQALEDVGFKGGKLGVDVGYVFLLDGLKATLPEATIVDGDTCLRQARLVKGSEEIKGMRVSCEAVATSFHKVLKTVDVGMREQEVLGVAMHALYDLGMEIPQCSAIVSSGDNLSPLARFASDRIIQYGDLVFMDFGGCFNGIFAEATRTVVCGKPNDRQKAIYRTVAAAMDAIVETMKPGATNVDVHEAVAKVFDKAGFGQYSLKTVLGHGIGVAGWEPPTLGDAAVTGAVFEFQPGMIFSLEPTLTVPGVPGGGGARIEDEILVTETGCEVMTRIPRDERLL